MILWTFKQLNSVRKAIADRRHPSQLAWGVAFGLLLGIVPHGNLLALALLLVVLSLKVNHAIAGLTAVAVTFAATHFDPYSDAIGRALLTDVDFHMFAAQAWQYPLVPWTDLNNTVVLGSFIIGLTALLPAFAVTYPVFRWLAPANSAHGDPDPASPSALGAVRHLVPETSPSRAASNSKRIVVVDSGHQQVVRPHHVKRPTATPIESRRDPKLSASSPTEHDFIPVEDSGASDELGTATQHPSDPDSITVETRIDVIRMVDHRDVNPRAAQGDGENQEPERPMDEALTYLLRQLRDSQQRNAA